MSYDIALLNKISLTSKTDAFFVGGLIKENNIKGGVESILLELERIKQNGFIIMLILKNSKINF